MTTKTMWGAFGVITEHLWICLGWHFQQKGFCLNWDSCVPRPQRWREKMLTCLRPHSGWAAEWRSFCPRL